MKVFYERSFIEQITKIAQKASLAILDVYNNKKNINIEEKTDKSPVTEADYRSNDILCEGLANLLPRLPIISEENTTIQYHERKHFDYYWLIDPLDGTREFIRANGQFCVNVALMKGNKPVLGVVAIPCEDTIYVGQKGCGAFVLKNGQQQIIKAASFNLNDENLTVYISRLVNNEGTQAYIDKLKIPKLIRLGSAIKFLRLAEGTGHLYPRLIPTMEWDTAAPQIILEEAGGHLLNTSTSEPLIYNKPDLTNPFFFAMGNVQNQS